MSEDNRIGDLLKLPKGELVGLIINLEDTLGIDATTGLKNSAFFQNHMKELIPELEKGDERRTCSTVHSAILFVDIDNFKRVIETTGSISHGNAVLRRVSETLKKLTRSLTDVLARWGADDIVIALPNNTEESAQKIAERLRLGIQELVFSAYPNLTVTVSIGVAATDTVPSLGWNAVFVAADIALYSAKTTGRNKVVCFSLRAPLQDGKPQNRRWSKQFYEQGKDERRTAVK